jgi:hypothetical protein
MLGLLLLVLALCLYRIRVFQVVWLVAVIWIVAVAFGPVEGAERRNFFNR